MPKLAIKLATKGTSSILDKLERKRSAQGVVRSGKEFTLFISNEDVDGIIKVINLLEDSGLLIVGATETAKLEITKQEGGFLGAMMAPMVASLIAPIASLLIQPVISSLINAISRKGVMRAGKGQEGRFLPLLTLPSIIKVLGKRSHNRRKRIE